MLENGRHSDCTGLVSTAGISSLDASACVRFHKIAAELVALIVPDWVGLHSFPRYSSRDSGSTTHHKRVAQALLPVLAPAEEVLAPLLDFGFHTAS